MATTQLACTLLPGSNVVYAAAITVVPAVLAAGRGCCSRSSSRCAPTAFANSTPTYGDRPVYADALVLS